MGSASPAGSDATSASASSSPASLSAETEVAAVVGPVSASAPASGWAFSAPASSSSSSDSEIYSLDLLPRQLFLVSCYLEGGRGQLTIVFLWMYLLQQLLFLLSCPIQYQNIFSRIEET